MTVVTSWMLIVLAMLVALFALRGLLVIVDRPKRERAAWWLERRLMQERIRSLGWDVMRNDDPLVRHELYEAIEEYRAHRRTA